MTGPADRPGPCAPRNDIGDVLIFQSVSARLFVLFYVGLVVWVAFDLVRDSPGA